MTDGTNTAHTPGPWGTNGSHIYAPDGEIIAVVQNPGNKRSDYPLVANRDLMASAPTLLSHVEVLRKALEPLLEAIFAAQDTGDEMLILERAEAARTALDQTKATQ